MNNADFQKSLLCQKFVSLLIVMTLLCSLKRAYVICLVFPKSKVISYYYYYYYSTFLWLRTSAQTDPFPDVMDDLVQPYLQMRHFVPALQRKYLEPEPKACPRAIESFSERLTSTYLAPVFLTWTERNSFLSGLIFFLDHIIMKILLYWIYRPKTPGRPESSGFRTSVHSAGMVGKQGPWSGLWTQQARGKQSSGERNPLTRGS